MVTEKPCNLYKKRRHAIAQKIQRCQIVMKPATFKRSFSRCLPTPEQACVFERDARPEHAGEKIKVTADLEEATGHPWEFLGSGVHRATYMFKPGCVIKIGDEDANCDEAGSYAVAPIEVKRLLVPVVSHSPSFRWIIAPYAQKYEEESAQGRHRGLRRDLTTRDVQEIQNALGKRLERADAYCPDMHAWNVGKLGGKPVLLDYGFGVRCKIPRMRAKSVQRRLTAFLER